jgi:hypothetical protein
MTPRAATTSAGAPGVFHDEDDRTEGLRRRSVPRKTGPNSSQTDAARTATPSGH